MNQKELIEKVFKKLSAMSDEEFHKELEKHKDGDIGRIILESGMLDVTEIKKTTKEDRPARDTENANSLPLGGGV